LEQHDEHLDIKSDANGIEYFDFNGIQVPFRPSEKMTVIQADGSTIVRSIPPAYVLNLKQYQETGSMVALQNAMLSMTKEALLSLVRSMSFKRNGWEAPTAVSASVPIDHVYIDRKSGRIVLNEWQATQRYIDADGDRGTVHPDKEQKKVELDKFPITDQPLLLTVMTEEPKEVFHNLTKRMLPKIFKDFPMATQLTDDPGLEEELFYKKHVDVPVGLRTSAWNCYDLYCSRNMSWEEKNNYIFASFRDPETGKTQRALDIEDAGMKSARKSGKQLQEAWVLEQMKKTFGASKALDNPYAWALTSCSSIGDMKGKQLDWFDRTDLDALMKDILQLKVGFRDVKAASQPQPKEVFVEGHLLARLKALNLIGWKELPHHDKNMPPAVLFWLQLPNNQMVALTDVKRDGREEGLTYMFLLAPVFDNVTLYDESGNVILEPRKEWVHPIDHMQKMICTFDSTIRPYHNGPISHYFPLDLRDWQNPKRSIKIAMLYKWLSDYCGRYGDPAPATKQDNKIVPSLMAKSTIIRTVVIDYGSNMDHLAMYPIAKEARKTCNFCMVGSKSTSRRIRKYMLANSKGGSILDPQGITNPYRGACQRSQLMRALKPCKMTVAIVRGETQTQVHITPTGVEKQKTDIAFLPQVANTEEAYMAHLEANNLTPEECPATIVDYRTWQGEHRRCWTVGARGTIRIGKLVDEVGNKFMPRAIGQAYYKDKDFKDTIPVDLLFPLDELIAKDAHFLFLQNAVEREVFLADGTTVKAMVIERTFWRTGAASENIPPRWRRCSYKGIDSFPIWWRLNQIEPLKERTCDTSFAKELQSIKRQILSQVGAFHEDEDEFLSSHASL
jgi:hypothetical protein